MENKTYVFHTDPGHGWLAVPLKDLYALGIEDKISGYSYVKGKTAYLEEDCDAAVFFDAKQQAGETVNTRVGKHWDRWPGRSFRSYNAAVITQMAA